MNKKIVAGIFIIAVAGAMLFGCGKKTADQPKEESTALETGREEKEAGNEPAQASNQTEDIEKEAKASVLKEGGWFEDQGLTITPQGDYTSSIALYDDTGTLLKTVDAVSNVEIINVSEAVGYNEYDYKKIVFLVEYEDIRNQVLEESQETGIWQDHNRPTVFCFDRNTGTAFSVADASVPGFEEEFKEKGLNGEAVYTVVSGVEETTVILYCPLDYEGAVFGVQDCLEEDSQMLSEFSEKVLNADRTIGKGPEIGPLLHDDCVFFSMTNE